MKSLILMILLLAAPIFAMPDVQFGLPTDKPVVADYDGDGKADIAVWRPSEGMWYILGSRRGFFAVQWGQAGDTPLAADYDGDGNAELIAIRPNPNGSATWFILYSDGAADSFTYWRSTDIPIIADFDHDGKADFGVYRNGTWKFF